MNTILYFLFLVLSPLFLQSNEVVIDFNHGRVVLEGGVSDVEIKGHDGQQVIITTSNGGAISEDNYTIKHKTLTVKLEDKHESVSILLPNEVSLICDFADWVEEINRDAPFRKVSIEGVGGAIEFNADGYDVNVKNPESHISIVTYGNITAWFDDFEEDTIISLDTYLGNVTAHIPLEIEANLNLTAMNGKVEMDKKFKVTRELRNSSNNFIGEINGGGIDVILHSESGSSVRLSKIK